MPLTFEGYFESGHFITDSLVAIPERRKAIVTMLDETANKFTEEMRQTMLWNEIFAEIENCDEELIGEPERLHLRTPAEIDAL